MLSGAAHSNYHGLRASWVIMSLARSMLRAGGSMHHSDLLAPFGLDAADPKFWDKGLSMISDMIDELEAMEA